MIPKTGPGNEFFFIETDTAAIRRRYKNFRSGIKTVKSQVDDVARNRDCDATNRKASWTSLNYRSTDSVFALTYFALRTIHSNPRRGFSVTGYKRDSTNKPNCRSG